MRGGRGSKAKGQRIHAKRRALERYDLDLNRHQMDELVRMIQRGQGRLLEKQSLRVSTFELNAFDKILYVVYDKHRKTIVTFLPEQYIKDLEAVAAVAI